MTALRIGRRPAAAPRSPDGTMSLVEHLVELRRRLFVSALALVVGMVVGFIVFPHVYHVLQGPYCKVPLVRRQTIGEGKPCTLNALSIVDPFKIRLQITFYTGLALASPVWLYQLWQFVTPGLYRHERRWSLAFVLSSLVLFAAGGFLAYQVLPTSLGALLGFGGHDTITTLVTVQSYLKFVQGMLLAFGVAFEMPLILIMLAAVGVLPGARLKRWWRGFVFGITVFTGFAVPAPDPFSMLALAVPLWVLFGLSVVIALGFDRRRARKQREKDQRIADELGVDVSTLSVPFVDVPFVE